MVKVPNSEIHFPFVQKNAKLTKTYLQLGELGANCPGQAQTSVDLQLGMITTMPNKYILSHYGFYF